MALLSSLLWMVFLQAFQLTMMPSTKNSGDAKEAMVVADGSE